jgi:glyoxylate/hydroxypyruvate reductase A
MAFLYKSKLDRGLVWQRMFAERLPDLPFRIWPDVGDPADITYLGVWIPPDDLTVFSNLQVLFSVAAGVDQLNLATVPDHVPVVRMQEPGLAAGMVEFVTMAVLALHRGMPGYLDQQRRRLWQEDDIRLADATRVGVMGLGVLGTAVLSALAPFGFQRRGWNRSARDLPGVTCYTGHDSLHAFAADCDIVVCLLPLTPDNRFILNATLFAAMPRGGSVINVGRGGHLVAPDLLVALDSGHLRAAVLDVTDPEPLPADDPLWSHPSIWLTPHVASTTQSETGAEAIIANIRRHQAGLPMEGLIDRQRGY